MRWFFSAAVVRCLREDRRLRRTAALPRSRVYEVRQRKMGKTIFVLALVACGKPGAPTDLAPTGDAAQKGPVDGISCDTSEQLLFHIHAHLAIYTSNGEKLVPAGVGIGPPLFFDGDFVAGGSCFSWLHTHDETGVIHIESPIEGVYTLGDFFDVWGQPLSTSQVGPVKGNVASYLNGAPFPGDPRTLPLDAHNLLQLDIDSSVPPRPYTFAPGL